MTEHSSGVFTCQRSLIRAFRRQIFLREMNSSRQTRLADSFTHITPSSNSGVGDIGSWEDTIAEVARHRQQTPGDESEKRETSQMAGELSVGFRELIAEMNVLNSVAVTAR
jgi:hypothetical protein